MAFASIDEKAAIVTGAGAGINLAFAQLLLSKGCNVVFADLALRPEAQKVVDAHSKGTPRAVFQQTDVRQWSHLDRLFEVCEENFGAADIVCPGAGVYEPVSACPLYYFFCILYQQLFSNFWIPPGTLTSTDSPSGNSYASLDINITHPIRTTQLAISHFIKHKRPGSIVHISSIAAQSSGMYTPLYVAAKHAISGFVRTFEQLETPLNDTPKIRVTAVAPGVVKTPLWLDNPEKLKLVDENVDEWITPEEVAERMLELVTKDEYVSGTILEVGKGQSRKVALLNDPGPSGAGMSVSNRGDGRDQVWNKLATEGWGQIPKP